MNYLAVASDVAKALLAQEVEATDGELEDLFAPDDRAQADKAGDASVEVEEAGGDECDVEEEVLRTALPGPGQPTQHKPRTAG